MGNTVKRTAFLFAATAVLVGAAASAADFQNGVALNLPGMRYCPAPDCDNGDFLDTYYSVDAKTGQLTAHTARGENDVDNSHLDTGEVMLLVAPNGNYDNRFVPPEAAVAGLAVAGPGRVPAVDPYSGQPIVAARGRADGPGFGADEDRVPWWRGGLWRNRKDDDGSDPRDDRDSSSDSYGEDDPDVSQSFDDDEMWEDEGEYSGYNPDGTFGRPANQQASRPPAPSAANFSPANPYPAQTQAQVPAPAPAPMPAPAPLPAPTYAGDLYATATAAYGDPGGGYAAPVPVQQPYISEPYSIAPDGRVYTDPNALAGTYYDAGSVYQGGPIDTSMYGGTTVYNMDGTTSQVTNGYDAGVYGATYGGTTYYDSVPSYVGALSPYDAAGYPSAPPAPVGAMAGATGADPFASAPPSYQGEPSIDAQGSPQFENAVRLVKDNRFTEAKGILTSETSRNPANASAWRWLGDCHYNLLELDDAINCYQRALERDPNDFYALRGQGFSYLHRGHEYWRQMQEQVARDQKDAAAATFAQAHDNYKKSLELLGLCLRRAPNDGEAIYGEAMAAEGASRKLYSNAISYLKLGPEQRERAELFAENCMTVINKGIERSRERARQNPGDAGPRALLGGLYMRKAILYHQLGRNDLALVELRNTRDVQQSILDEIDKNNATAQRNLRECESYWEEWGGNRQ